MHYSAIGFKSDGEIAWGANRRTPLRLQFISDEIFQCMPNFQRHFHLAARAKAACGRDGLSIGPDEFSARRAIAKMVVEPLYLFRGERSLHVVEEQALNITAAKRSAK